MFVQWPSVTASGNCHAHYHMLLMRLISALFSLSTAVCQCPQHYHSTNQLSYNCLPCTITNNCHGHDHHLVQLPTTHRSPSPPSRTATCHQPTTNTATYHAPRTTHHAPRTPRRHFNITNTAHHHAPRTTHRHFAIANAITQACRGRHRITRCRLDDGNSVRHHRELLGYKQPQHTRIAANDQCLRLRNTRAHCSCP
jgi:hypothetical protein